MFKVADMEGMGVKEIDAFKKKASTLHWDNMKDALSKSQNYGQTLPVIAWGL
jgi:hypothetical protein